MLPEILVEALSYFDRTFLEGLQMYSRYLRDLVNVHEGTLPLRYFYEADSTYSVVYFQMLETDRDYASQHQLCSEETRDRMLENVFRCINNAFIDRLEISFHRHALPLPYYVRANAEHLQCKILTLCVSGLPVRIDYALFDFLAVHLDPQVYEMSLRTWIWSADYAMYFAHDAFQGNVRHVVCELDDPPVPDCIIPALLSTDVVKTCTVTTRVDPRAWIGKFVEKFKVAEHGTDIIRSVTVFHTRFHTAAPLRKGVQSLVQPLRTDFRRRTALSSSAGRERNASDSDVPVA